MHSRSATSRPLLLLALVAVLALVSAPPAVRAQTSGDRRPPTPIFRAGVELVRLDVRVVDDQQRPVKDLRIDEIEVRENGERRPIVSFQHIEEPAGTYVEIARRTVAGEVSTNRGAARGQLYVLVFDQQHISPGNEQRARLAAETFLKTRVRPGDRVALFALPGPGPQVDFTSDVGRVASELVRVRGGADRIGLGGLGAMRIFEAYQIVRGDESVLFRVAERLSAQTAASDFVGPRSGASRAPGGAAATPDADFNMLVKADARTIVSRADEEGRRFLVMLSDVIRGLQGIEGRKAIVLFSEGFFTDHVSRELELVAAAAARSYSVIYAMDLNRRDVQGATEPSALASGASAEPAGGEPFREIDDRIAPLGSLAIETDGLLVTDASARVQDALTRLANESQDYYLVGFEPAPDSTRDRDQYRRIKVSVTRDGVRASTRTGYALPGEPTPADRRRAINVALGAPFPQQNLPVEYTTYTLGGSAPGLHRVVLALTADLPLASPNARSADVVFVARSMRDGRVVASGTDVMPLPESAGPGRPTGAGVFRVQFEVPAGEYLMRVVVREPGGQIGSADRRFDARPVPVSGVSASDLVIGSRSQALPVRAAARADEALTGFVELYARSHDELDGASVQVDLVPLGSDVATTSTDALVLPVQDGPSGFRRVAQVELPLGGIAPGHYVARATVRSSGETVGRLLREVEIQPATAEAGTRAAAITTPAFNPEAVLDGAIVRNLVAGLPSAADDAIARAAKHALDGAWDHIDMDAVPPTPAGHVLRGLSSFARRDYLGAAAVLKLALDLEPHNAPLAFVLGWVHEATGDHRQAIGAWRNAALHGPTLVPVHLALADTYVKLAQPALAVQALKAGLAALPESPELRDRLARLEQR
jgi:VWFA-related protein